MAKEVKPYIKLPMVFLSMSAGLICGLQSSFMRGFTIQVTIEDGHVMVSTYIYLSVSVLGAIYQLYLINLAQQSYDQVEIGPIYQASLILFSFVCGAVILDEKRQYETSEMLILIGIMAVIILGILILLKKPNFNFYMGENESEGPTINNYAEKEQIEIQIILDELMPDDQKKRL